VPLTRACSARADSRKLALAHRTDHLVQRQIPHVILLTYLAWTLLCLGYLDQARAKREAALAEARCLSGAFTLAHTLSWATHAEAILVGPSGALVHAEEMVSVTERQGIDYYLTYAMAFQGWCLTMLGQQEKGITLLTRALEVHRRALGLTRLQTVLTLMADAYCKVRQPDDGLRQLAEAISVTSRTQGRYYEAEMHRVRGDLYLSIHDDGAAEASFREAISVAQHQSAKTWEPNRLRWVNGVRQVHCGASPLRGPTGVAGRCGVDRYGCIGDQRRRQCTG